ncbi:MAG: AmmeMemoRadiSam system radical SAM enzyme, partial [Deltaproteobacteria bacterium]|nr:AmmeMemoRadiSam system radical SAM enzyme [Deltaproteobacteria bacterium]
MNRDLTPLPPPLTEPQPGTEPDGGRGTAACAARRLFLRRAALLAAGTAGGALGLLARPAALRAEDPLGGGGPVPIPQELGPEAAAAFAVRALYWQPLPQLKVECTLCPRRCRVADRERGSCGVRENRGGVYYTLVHGRAVSANLDPIEKKPFFHVLPGSGSFSIATAGCNLECRFCQNWRISQFRPEQVEAELLPPRRVHELARRAKARTIAYTYSEPTVFFEYMLDTARLGQETGIRSVMVSSGYISLEPLRQLAPHLAAVKIDLKAFSDGFYKELCRGTLQPVLQALQELRRLGRWLEIVVLLVPSYNDSDKELKALCGWVRQELGP